MSLPGQYKRGCPLDIIPLNEQSLAHQTEDSVTFQQILGNLFTLHEQQQARKWLDRLSV